MKLFLVRHGKSDESLKEVLPYNEFELKRALLPGEEEKAVQLGKVIKNQLTKISGFDLVFSGKVRSKQTVVALAKGLGLSDDDCSKNLREDFGLSYLADERYWEAAETAIKNETFFSHADFFLQNSPETYFSNQNIHDFNITFTANYMKQNMKAVLKRAIERNIFLGNDVVVMVSHEPVLSLCMNDLTEKPIKDLGGAFAELEFATITTDGESFATPSFIELLFRGNTYSITEKLL